MKRPHPDHPEQSVDLSHSIIQILRRKYQTARTTIQEKEAMIAKQTMMIKLYQTEFAKIKRKLGEANEKLRASETIAAKLTKLEQDQVTSVKEKDKAVKKLEKKTKKHAKEIAIVRKSESGMLKKQKLKVEKQLKRLSKDLVAKKKQLSEQVRQYLWTATGMAVKYLELKFNSIDKNHSNGSQKTKSELFERIRHLEKNAKAQNEDLLVVMSESQSAKDRIRYLEKIEQKLTYELQQSNERLSEAMTKQKQYQTENGRMKTTQATTKQTIQTDQTGLKFTANGLGNGQGDMHSTTVNLQSLVAELQRQLHTARSDRDRYLENFAVLERKLELQRCRHS